MFQLRKAVIPFQSAFKVTEYIYTLKNRKNHAGSTNNTKTKKNNQTKQHTEAQLTKINYTASATHHAINDYISFYGAKINFER